MKVAYVVKRFPRLSETFILNELLALERQTVDIEIFSLKQPRPEPRHELLSALRAPVTYLPDVQVPAHPTIADRDGADTRARLQAVALAALGRRRGVTHMHAHFANRAATVTRIASRLSGIPYSLTAHAKDVFDAGVDHDALAAKIRDARFVVTVSDYNRRYLIDRFGRGGASRIVRLYNGLDLARFAPDPAVRVDAGHVLAVGRLVEKKGFQHLVDACAALRSRGVNFRCTIVGDGPERASLASRIGAARLEGTVTLAGALPQERVLASMRSAALFVLPCVVSESGDRDGLPTVLLEALAVGLPAISTSLPGIDEIIDHGRTGVLVPPGDSERLADGIAELLSRPDLRRRLATAGRRKAEASFDSDRTTPQLLRLFSRSTARGRPASRDADPLPVL